MLVLVIIEAKEWDTQSRLSCCLTHEHVFVAAQHSTTWSGIHFSFSAAVRSDELTPISRAVGKSAGLSQACTLALLPSIIGPGTHVTSLELTA